MSAPAAEQARPGFSPGPPLCIHPATPEALRPGLAEAFGRADFGLGDGEGAIVVAPYAAVDQVGPNRRVVALHNGQLNSSHAQALRRTPPAMLLACREASLPASWELRVLRTVLSGAPLYSVLRGPKAWRVGAVFELKAVSERAAEAAQAAGARASAVSRAADVMYELVANALLDAPATPDGTPKYAHRRSEALEIEPADACRAALAVENDLLYLSATDRFGRLTISPVARAISAIGEPARVDDSGGGAGLGMRRILEQSELFAARITPGVVSEVVCVVDLRDTRRRATGLKSLFFTSAGG